MKKLFVILMLIMCIPNAFSQQKRIISPEEVEFLKKVQQKSSVKVPSVPSVQNSEKTFSEAKSEIKNEEIIAPSDEVIASEIKKEKKKVYKTYKPAPVVIDPNRNGYLVERDSPKIVTKSLSYLDSLDIKMCSSAGVSIAFDESMPDVIQRNIIDDNEYFEAKLFSNNKGLYVRLKDSIPAGSHWESALRIVSNVNDKTFLVNLIGVPCPTKGSNPFPKIYYIKNKSSNGFVADSKTLTPEDTIIEAAGGLPRKNKNIIRFYDMVTTANSEWMVFGVEMQFPNSKEKQASINMKVLESLQIHMLPSNLQYLDLQSQAASKFWGVPTMRFKLAVKVNKSYMTDSRFIYVMVLDKVSGHHQYKQIDLMQYFISLKKRGFNI